MEPAVGKGSAAAAFARVDGFDGGGGSGEDECGDGATNEKLKRPRRSSPSHRPSPHAERKHLERGPEAPRRRRRKVFPSPSLVFSGCVK
jgi:hypothetical protein